LTLTKPPLWQIILILFIGIVAVSTAAIFIRLGMSASGEIQSFGFSLFLAASRLIVASLILLPAWRNIQRLRVEPKAYYYAIAAGICLALHFAAWITSLAYTSIAASTTLVTTNPIWVALLSWLWWREKLSRQTLIGIVIALGGTILIALGDANFGGVDSNPILGDFLALCGSWLVSLYLLFGSQAQKQGLGIGHYIAIAYSTGALVLFPLPFLFHSNYWEYPREVYLYVLLLAIFSQLIGHTSFNWALRWLSPTSVTLSILFEPISSSFLGFFFFGELPSQLVLLGGLILLTGVAIAIVGKKELNKH
jgi:drug/metabolite transporter (DMT)-like permease